jgi:signal transduction histidine kinase
MNANKRGMTLFQWVWRAYFKASLIPLLVLEIALISVYFLSNRFASHENISTIHELAEQELTHLAAREANGINHQLDSISHAASYLQDYSAVVMANPQNGPKDNPARFAYSLAGAYYTTQDTGGSAVFYSGFVAIGKTEREKALRSIALDPALIGIKKAFPLVAQTYFNSYDSLNRIYPYFDVIKQYPEKMDIPSYNFYYEADAKHNPKRGTVWTDVYIDPAGQGWMTSCIAPVYNPMRPDFLEGVVGIDITIKNIVDEVKKLDIPWHGYAVLISRSGTILALPQAAERDWGINGLTDSDYSSSIKQDTFRAEEYNVYLKPAIASAMKNTANGSQHVTLTQDNLLAWATIASTGWKIVIVAPEENIFRPANALADRLDQIAILMVMGMLLFYSLFFYMLHRRAIIMSLSISEPLKHIDSIVAHIASGIPVKSRQRFRVAELNSTAEGILDMGTQLESAKKARAKATEELRKKSEQLQVIFDVSPSGYVLVDDQHNIILSNNAFTELLGITQSDMLALKEQGFLEQLASQAKNLPDLSICPEQLHRIELVRPRPSLLLCGVRDIHMQQNTVLGKLYFFHDISKDEEIDRIKSDFLTHAAHELRTPLSSILGYSELLLSGRIAAAMQPDVFKLIYGQSGHLVDMINELLDLTRVTERSGSDFTILPLSLTDLIDEAIKTFQIPEGRNRILFDQPLFDVAINADHVRFRQVLLNIIDNAYKFSKKGSDIYLNVNADPDTQSVTIDIKDQGIGMTEAEQAQAFDRFYRADKSGNVPGTGLGLSLAKEIITLLGGTIHIHSQPAEGTRVSIVMPTAYKKSLN